MVRAQAAKTGYANRFEAVRAAIVWRPALQGSHTKPRLSGPLVATVVGPSSTNPGTSVPSGAQEIYCDRLGRIQVQFEFQAHSALAGVASAGTSAGSTWVRVAQRWAGAGMGAQFLPRIGQQVLVGFADGDCDRPIVIGAVYDGRGEGGLAPTPGGQTARTPSPGGQAGESDTSVFKPASDASPAAQGNLVGAGHSPAWHGAAAGEHHNAAALSGWKTKEFGNDSGSGFNQLVFDDTNAQLRTQLASSAHASQLNLGHLVHQADNFRGSFRGQGFELRTDAYGALRAGQGLLISSFGTQPPEPAGDNAAGIALGGQMKTLAQAFSQAAITHQSARLAAHEGTLKASQSAASDRQAPLAGLHTVLKGMVSAEAFDAAQGDASARNTSTAQDKLPHTGEAMIALAAKAGLASASGAHLQWQSAEAISVGAGQNLHLGAGGALRIHTGQAIGIAAGVVKAGAGAAGSAAGTGITLAAKQDVAVQAQADKMQIAAKGALHLKSQSGKIDWAAAKRIVLANEQGANITIEGGNITVTCPGKLTIKAATKGFMGPETGNYNLPILPRCVCVECLAKRASQRSAFVNKGA